VPLRNARHERFAHGLADGKSQAKAYSDAGFSPKHADKNASKLLRVKPEILRRRDELLAEREQDRRAVQAELIQRTAIDKQWIIDKLVEVVERCMQAVPVADKEGKLVLVETPNGKIAPAYVFSERGANAALRTLAAVTGNLVVRHKNEKGPLDSLPPEAVRALEQALTIRLEALKPGLQRLPVTIEGEESASTTS
jgi:phage terminase small subunit